MARYRGRARSRTPIKNTRTYKKGMVQVMLVSIIGLSVALRTQMGKQLVSWINSVVPGGEA